MDQCVYFPINSAQFYFNNTETVRHTPVCNSSLTSKCQVSCSSTAIMDLLTLETFTDSVLKLKQFWIFFFIISLFWMSQAAVYSLGDSICFDQLGKYFN